MHNKTNEELYFELKEKMFDVLESEDFYEVFNNSIRSGKNNISLYQRYMNSVIDIKWVEKIEDSLIALDNIIRNPQRFIKETEEVIPIEQVKKVSENSIKHLAQNTNFIAKVDEKGYITPSRILNVQKDETFETYENRFIYTLLVHLQYFIDKRLKVLHDSRVKSEYRIEMENEFSLGNEKVEYQFSLKSIEKTESKAKDLDLNADTSQMEAIQRVERLIQIMYDFQNSHLIKSLKGVTLVKPPIMRTNVILKNPNFKKALELWQYIETYYDAGLSIELVENEVIPSDDYLNDLFTTTLINYCMFNYHIKPAKKLAAKSPTLKKIKPNFVQHIVKDYLEDLTIDVDIVEKVFVDKIKRATQKRKDFDKEIEKALQKAIDKETNNKEKQDLQDQKRIERALKEMAKRKREEAKRQRELEQQRLKELAELEAKADEEKVEQPALEPEVEEVKQPEVEEAPKQEEVQEVKEPEQEIPKVEEEVQSEEKPVEVEEPVVEEVVQEEVKVEKVVEETIEEPKKKRNKFLDFLKRLFGKKKSQESDEEDEEETVEPVEEEKVEEPIVQEEELDEDLEDEEEDENDNEQEVVIDQETGQIIRKPAKPFAERILDASEQVQNFYNTLKNELLSYKKIKSRISKKCDSFRLGRALKAKMVMSGKTLKLFLALDPNEFNPNVYHQKDMSHKKTYADVPMMVKVKSDLGLRRAITLIEILMGKNDVVKNPKYEYKDYILDLRLLNEDDDDESDESDNEQETVIDQTTGQIIRKPYKPFANRIVDSSKENKRYYNTLKNELLSYKKIKNRISKRCENFRLGRVLEAKMVMGRKTFKLFLSLNPNEFNTNIYHQKDMSHKKAYASVPMLVKVKSELGLRRAITLITILMEKNNVIKNPKYQEKDYIKDLKELIKANEEAIINTEVDIEDLDNDSNEHEIIIDSKTGQIIRRPYKPFVNRIIETSEENKHYYNTLKNELLSYKRIKNRMSKRCENFRLGRVLEAKMVMGRKTFKLFLSLNPNEFNTNIYHQKDMSHKKIYASVPMLVRVKSDLGLKRAITLITILMEKNNVIKNPKYQEKDYFEELIKLNDLITKKNN